VSWSEAKATDCPECGAPGGGDTCHAAFDELLALEFERPAAFAVHHFTVACYYVQHPSGHEPAVLSMWHELIADSLDGKATPADLMKRAGLRFEGAVRVRAPGAQPPDWWPRSWPVSVHDTVAPRGEAPNADGHIARVRRWAKATRATLDAAKAARA
jgi:hypothetical protein